MSLSDVVSECKQGVPASPSTFLAVAGQRQSGTTRGQGARHTMPSGSIRISEIPQSYAKSVSNRPVSQTAFPGRLHDAEIQTLKGSAISAVMHDL